MIFAFLAQNWRLVALGVVILAVGGYIAVLKLQLRHCNNENEALTAQVSGLRQAVEAQNAAVASLKAQSDAKVKKATQGLVAARTASKAAQTEAERLKAAAALKSAPVAAGGCLAGDGVRMVRDGLL